MERLSLPPVDGGAKTLMPGGPVAGSVTVPPSKSLTNRAMVVAAAAGGGTIEQPLDCEDTRLLARALDECGWPVQWERSRVDIGPRRVPDVPVSVMLGNSGTGARFLLALAAATEGQVTVDGTARLRERPMGPLIEALRELGADVTAAEGGRLPATVRGRVLHGGTSALEPAVSSQFASALMIAAPLMRKGLELSLEGHVPSRPYLDLTQHVLTIFGARVRPVGQGNLWRVDAAGLKPSRYHVEGDWSAAAFPLCAAAVAGGCVTVVNADPASAQGDRAVLGFLEQAGCTLRREELGVRVQGPAGRPFEAALQDTPDLFPALSVVAASGPAGSRLTGLAALQHKESDRLSVMADNLRAAGARVMVDGVSFRVDRSLPPAPLPVRHVTAAADHRIAMAMALAALRTGPLQLDDASCVVKSYPSFWQHWEQLMG